MAILITETTKVLVQGMSGRIGLWAGGNGGAGRFGEGVGGHQGQAGGLNDPAALFDVGS